MKKVTLMVSLFLLVFAMIAMAATVPADKMKIDLKTAWGVQGRQKAVMFNHTQHIAKLKCADCHSSPDGNTKIEIVGVIKGTSKTNPAHKYCWTCHAKQPKDPVRKTCTKCHTG